MLIIEAEGAARRDENAALEALNVPRVSISSTVRNPLELSCSAAERKLPAAQLTRMEREPNRDVVSLTMRSQSAYERTSPCKCGTSIALEYELEKVEERPRFVRGREPRFE